MNRAIVLLLVATLAACAANPGRYGRVDGTGTVEAIERPDVAAAGDASGVKGVATVLAGGSLSTPPGNAAPAASTTAGAAATGALASAIATAPGGVSRDGRGFRIRVRLSTGALRTIEQPEPQGIEVGQRVRIRGDRVVPDG